MKTWDDVKYLYYSIASKLLPAGNQFQIDELVNEAWIMTYPYINVPNYKLPHKIYRVIQSYMNNQKQKYRDNYAYRNIHIGSIDEIQENLESDVFADERSHDLEGVEIYDYLDNIVIDKTITSKEAIILYMKFILYLTQEEISNVCQLTHQRISQIIKEAFTKIKIECGY